MIGISDFDDADRWVVESALRQRYGKHLTVELADIEIRLHTATNDIAVYPTFYREEQIVEFVIFKIAENRCRSRFCYSLTERYGTGENFADLAQCITTTLRLQADHEKERAGVT
jgi:hypothetical protein